MSRNTKGAFLCRITLRVIAFMGVMLLAACSSTKTEVLPPTVNVSVGQQSINLKAKESGAISEKEYQTQMKRVIDSVK